MSPPFRPAQEAIDRWLKSIFCLGLKTKQTPPWRFKKWRKQDCIVGTWWRTKLNKSFLICLQTDRKINDSSNLCFMFIYSEKMPTDVLKMATIYRCWFVKSLYKNLQQSAVVRVHQGRGFFISYWTLMEKNICEEFSNLNLLFSNKQAFFNTSQFKEEELKLLKWFDIKKKDRILDFWQTLWALWSRIGLHY